MRTRNKQRPGIVCMADSIGAVTEQGSEGSRPASAQGESAEEGRCPAAACGVCGNFVVGPLRRKFALMSGIAASITTANSQVRAEIVQQLQTACAECGGDGTVQCVTCKGSGQFKMLSFREGSPEAQYQFVDCPECNGVGILICPRCYGTGLPPKKLKGFLKDEAFKKVRDQLRRQRQRMDLDALAKMRDDAKEAVAAIEKRRATKA